MAKILIVDDSDVTRTILKGILVSGGHTVVGEAINASQAIKLFKELRPELVTMDVLMPRTEGLDGVGAVREIIKEEPKAKIIMISAEDRSDLIVEAIQAGAKDFIIKPFQAKNISASIERTLKG